MKTRKQKNVMCQVVRKCGKGCLRKLPFSKLGVMGVSLEKIWEREFQAEGQQVQKPVLG